MYMCIYILYIYIVYRSEPNIYTPWASRLTREREREKFDSWRRGTHRQAVNVCVCTDDVERG